MDPADEGAFPAMSPADVLELTEAAEDKQNGLKQQGSDALEDGKLDVALEKLTEAIVVGCASGLLYSRRAQLLLKLDRPRACVNDCTAALAINPDSAKAFKMRARAYSKLHMWEEAHSDFQTGLKLDYDEETYDESLEVAAKAKEISAAAVLKRKKEEDDEYNKKLRESKEAYEVGLRANEEKFREARMKEEEERQKKEQDRRERVKKQEEKNAAAAAESAEPGEPGVPKSHSPAEPGAGTEDVD